MTSKKPLGLAVAALAGLAAALPSSAQQRPMASAPSWYFGAGLGASYAKYDSGFNDVANQLNQGGFGGGGLSQSTSRETSHFSWKAFLGYRFNPYVGVEGSYVNLGSLDYQYAFTQNGVQTGNGQMSYEVESWNLAVVPRYPFANGAFVQGKLGAAFTNTTNSLNLNVPGFSQQSSPSDWRTNVLLGAGVGYDFPNGLSIIGEYEYFGKVGDNFSVNPSSGLQGTGRADMSLFSVSGLIRF